MAFVTQLEQAWRRNESLVCVGLDPEPARFPAGVRDAPDALFAFCRDIVDATADLVCCFKPQIAHFAALRAEEALERLIAHIHAQHPGLPVILDAKRGDIGSTAQNYAIEAFDRYDADAVTANPYLGRDSVQPFLDRADRGVVLLCRTSNPGARDLQDLVVANAGGAGQPSIAMSRRSSRANGTRTATARSSSAQPTRANWPKCARSSAPCRCWCRVSVRRAATSPPSCRTGKVRPEPG
jgi:orotidine-5'-phosphate decarboxylase